MSIHRIRQLGDPILRTRCETVADPKSPAARMVAHHLRETLTDSRERTGTDRGIAAPQIGAPIRMVLIEVDDPMLMVNPEILDVGTDDFHVWEDCFSFPDLMVKVQRAYRIKVRYHDRQGDEHVLNADGPLAELIQHEIDHLDGVLSVDHPAGLDPFCMRSEWNKHYAHDGRYGEPFPRMEPSAVLAT